MVLPGLYVCHFQRTDTVNRAHFPFLGNAFPYPDGGLVFGGGGFFMPRRKYSPVSFRFQLTEIFCSNGLTMVMAPGRGHSATQQPPYQHSSG